MDWAERGGRCRAAEARPCFGHGPEEGRKAEAPWLFQGLGLPRCQSGRAVFLSPGTVRTRRENEVCNLDQRMLADLVRVALGPDIHPLHRAPPIGRRSDRIASRQDTPGADPCYVKHDR